MPPPATRLTFFSVPCGDRSGLRPPYRPTIMLRSPRLAAPLVLALLAACKGTEPDPPVVVRPSTCSATDDAVAPTAIAIGEARVLSGPAVNCVRLAGTGAGSQYIAIVGNDSTTPDQVQRFTLAFDAPGGAVSADRAPAASPATLGARLTAPPRLQDVHERLLAEARRLDLGAARATRAMHATSGDATSPSLALPDGIRGGIFPAGTTPTVGQSATVRVPSLKTGDAPCTVFSTITATVKHVSQRAIILQDNTAPANGFSTADFQAIGTEFDNLIYATDTAYFGTGSDEDANGRIVILYTPEVNKATPRGSNSLLAGFFWAGDLFPRTGSGGCNQSNVAELFYLLVPDPTGAFSTARQVTDVREKTRGTVAHEFEHMLNAGSRLNNPAVRDFEDVWLDEALAHMAEELVGRAKLGAGDLQELTHAQVFDVGNNLRDYNAFFFQNFARFEDWLRAPGIKAPISDQADTSLAVRGAAWALVRYAADNYSGDNPKAFVRALATGPGIGIANLTSKLSSGASLETVLAGWHVANYADNLNIPNLPQRFTYRSWNIRDVVGNAVGGAYPLAITTLTADATQPNEARSSGGAVYYRFTVGGGSFAAVQVTNATGTTAGFSGGRLVILRAQ